MSGDESSAAAAAEPTDSTPLLKDNSKDDLEKAGGSGAPVATLSSEFSPPPTDTPVGADLFDPETSDGSHGMGLIVTAKVDWQVQVFVSFLQTYDHRSKYGFKTKEESLKLTFEDYKNLEPNLRAELRAAWFASQSKENVDSAAKYTDYDGDEPSGDLGASWDCSEMNKTQGYWNGSGLVNCGWGRVITKMYYKWAFMEAIPQLGSMWFVLYFLFFGLVQLRVYLPEAYYGLIALFGSVVVAVYLQWLVHLATGGWKTWWEDISVEKTVPPMVRPNSIDYWSMVWAALVWLLLDVTGGWQMLWVLAAPGALQLYYAAHCTLSSPDRSYVLGVLYIMSGLVWQRLWYPCQECWIRHSKKAFTYNARHIAGCINPNITFMTNSIAWSFLLLVPEFCSWLFHEKGANLSWWASPLYLIVLASANGHIGLCTLLMMGIAKLTAYPYRADFDEFGMCYSTGWISLP